MRVATEQAAECAVAAHACGAVSSVALLELSHPVTQSANGGSGNGGDDGDGSGGGGNSGGGGGGGGVELRESSDGAKGTLRLRLAVGVRLSVLKQKGTKDAKDAGMTPPECLEDLLHNHCLKYGMGNSMQAHSDARKALSTLMVRRVINLHNTT